jgi:hypothetical protein
MTDPAAPIVRQFTQARPVLSARNLKKNKTSNGYRKQLGLRYLLHTSELAFFLETRQRFHAVAGLTDLETGDK